MRGFAPPGFFPRRLLVALALLAGAGALVVAPPGASAQDSPPAATAAPAPVPEDSTKRAARPLPRVASLTFAGNARVDSIRIARAFEVRPGDVYDTRAVREGLLRLWSTNLFDDLEVRGTTLAPRASTCSSTWPSARAWPASASPATTSGARTT